MLFRLGLQELPLRGPCFIAVSLRVEIEGRLNPRMTQNTLHRFRLHLGGVHEEGAERVPEIVEAESLAVRNLHAYGFSCWPEIVGHDDRRGKRNLAHDTRGRPKRKIVPFLD